MMTTIQLTGHVDVNGRIEFSEQVNLPPGDVLITIQALNAEDEVAQDAFDDLLASQKSLTFLQALAAEAWAAHDAGLADDLDPDSLLSDLPEFD